MSSKLSFRSLLSRDLLSSLEWWRSCEGLDRLLLGLGDLRAVERREGLLDFFGGLLDLRWRLLDGLSRSSLRGLDPRRGLRDDRGLLERLDELNRRLSVELFTLSESLLLLRLDVSGLVGLGLSVRCTGLLGRAVESTGSAFSGSAVDNFHGSTS